MSPTFHKLQRIIVIQHLFCINRANLIVNKKLQISCHVIFFAASSIFCYNLVCDFFLRTDTIAGAYTDYIKQFQLLLAAEVMYISLISRLRVKTFEAFERLDEKCHIHGESLEIGINARVVMFIVSIVLDVVGMTLLGMPGSTIYILSTAFAAHDTECQLYSMLISVLNKRLQNLSTISFQGRARVFKHTLLAAAQFNEEYTFRISVMVFITMVSSLVYSGILLMSNGFATMTLIIFLVWRETKVLYTLWSLCSATYESEMISKKLVFYLAKQVAIADESNDFCNNITRRWYSSVRLLQPRYGNGAIGMSTPLIILDLTFNYLLIIMQIHAELISNKA